MKKTYNNSTFPVELNADNNKTPNQTITVIDIDGNVYTTVTIGSQIWLKQNLKTTRYNNGNEISNVTNNYYWKNLNSPAFCWYDNDSATYKNTYGALYNWYAVNTSKLCPNGWHVPSDSEWTSLTDYLGGKSIAGSKLKETGTSHWISHNEGNNSSGFAALPGGFRDNEDGTFGTLGINGYWWSATEHFPVDIFYCWLYANSTEMGWDSSIFKTNGFSVRCIKY